MRIQLNALTKPGTINGEVEDLVQKVLEMPPKFQRIVTAMIETLHCGCKGPGFIWRAFPSLMSLDEDQMRVLLNQFKDAAFQLHKTGNKERSRQVSDWAYEIVVLNLCRNKPGHLRKALCCHAPAATGLN